MFTVAIQSLGAGKTSSPGEEKRAPQRLVSTALLAGKREVVILHGTREYRLRVTQNGKLILTA